MPVGKILPYHALKTLTQLHAELGGKIDSNQKSGDKLRAQMIQVEAVMKMLDPEVNVRGISIKRRVIGNPWFKRGTMFRSAVDAMRRAGKPLTCREITDAVLEGKTPQPTRQQAINVQAAILAALQKRDGTAVVGEGTPTRWSLRGTTS